MPRAVYLRSLLHRPPEVTDVASKEEALGILAAMARERQVTAAIALAKELASSEPPATGDPLDELLKVG
jgi:hypothetical protein